MGLFSNMLSGGKSWLGGTFSSGSSRLALGMGVGGAGIGFLASDEGHGFRGALIGGAIGAGGGYGIGRYFRSLGREVSAMYSKKGARMASNQGIVGTRGLSTGGARHVGGGRMPSKKGTTMASNQSIVGTRGLSTGGARHVDTGGSWQAKMGANYFPGTQPSMQGMLAGSQAARPPIAPGQLPWARQEILI